MLRFSDKSDQIFMKRNLLAFIVLCLCCFTQNLCVELFLYHDQLSEGKLLSWAPLAPTGQYFNPLLFEFNDRSVMLQSQLPWLILPAVLYKAVITLANKSSDQTT